MLDTLLLLAQTTDATAAAQTAAEAATHAAASLKIWAYVAFIALVLVFLALDLGVFHREAHEVKMKEAITWSIVWLTCGLSFTAFVYFAYQHHWLGLGLETPMYNPAYDKDIPGSKLIMTGEVTGAIAAKQYLTGYLIEKSLSMDNIFVIALIFSFFAVPAKYQHRVLFWGIIGALLMRGIMIFLGGALIMEYQWVLIIFGLFLVFTALKMALIKGNDDVSDNIVVKLCKKAFRITEFYDGQKFFTKRTVKPTYSIVNGKEVMDPPPPGSLSVKSAITPLFLTLVLVEITDLIFAVDSIPAIFAITPDPFIVFTSNIFAILGLRALYFCLAALIAKFRFLKPALILILGFVGVKLLLLSVPPYLKFFGRIFGQTWDSSNPIKIDTSISLAVVLGTLTLAVILSIFLPAKAENTPATPAK